MTRRLQMTDAGAPIMEIINGGEPAPAGPFDLFAEALIARVCRGCGAVRAADRRRIRVVSTGEWCGTAVIDAWSEEPITETFSVILEEGRGVAAAVLAYYTEPRDGRAFVALCPTCVKGAA